MTAKLNWICTECKREVNYLLLHCECGHRRYENVGIRIADAREIALRTANNEIEEELV